MKAGRILSGVLAAVLVVSVACSCSSEPEEPLKSGPKKPEKLQLKINLKKGETYKIKMVVDQKISQTIMEMKQDMTQAIGIVFSCNVTDVGADGTMTIKGTYDSVSFKNDGPMGLIEYDSTKPPVEVPDMAKGFAALVGQGYSWKMTPNGTITEVLGAQEMVERMLAKLDVPEGPQKAAMEKSMRDQFSDQAVKRQLQKTMVTYPDKPVAIGDSWQKTASGAPELPCIMENTWTLKSVKDGVAVIEVDSKLKPDPDAQPMDMGLMKVERKLSGEQKGTMEVDIATGWTIKARMTQRISGTLKMEGLPEGAEGMSWPISVESIMTIETIGK